MIFPLLFGIILRDGYLGNTPNSLFSHYLIEGLTTGDADFNKDGLITIDELYSYVFTEVNRASNKKQKPKKWVYGQEGEQIVIANSRKSIRIPTPLILPSKIFHVTTNNLITKLTESIRNVICPYCLTEIRYYKNSSIIKCQCNAELPEIYVRDYENCPPLFLPLIGWSGVGKTVYLQALTAMLMKMGMAWRNNYAPMALTEPTLRYTRNVKAYMTSGEMPPMTQIQIQEAYIMQLEKMARWGNRTLIIRDVAGEHFNDLKFPIEQTPYMLYVPTTLMVISIDDLKKQNFTMDELMNSYIQTLLKHDINFGKSLRKAIIVLSKADLVWNELSDTLKQYMNSDPVNKFSGSSQNNLSQPILEMHTYMGQLQQVSDEISNWLNEISSGRTLINIAKKEDIELRFTLVSSLGGAPGNNGNMLTSISPTRVLDPLFWALELQSDPG